MVQRLRPLLPGLLASTGLALAATLAGRFVPILGAPVVAMALGVLTGRGVPAVERLRPGLAFAGTRIVQAAIVVSGFGISLVGVARTGIATLPVTLVTVAVALIVAVPLGRALGLDRTLRRLVGVGTAICGASAIAAVSSVIEPAEADVAIAIATIFAYNVAAVVLFPALGHLLHLSQDAFGLWAGTAINDTSSVVAAGYAYGREAGIHATIVKLARAMLILPVVAAIALDEARRRRASDSTVPWRRIVPWFLGCFLLAALANTANLIPRDAHPAITAFATFLITVALAAIGLQTDPRLLLRAGAKPLAFGLLLWVAVASSSLAMQRALRL